MSKSLPVGLFLGLIGLYCAAQEPAAAEARRILAQAPPAELSKLRLALLAIGDPAIEPIIEAIAGEKQATPIRLAFLVDVLASIGSEGAQQALSRLLLEKRPLIRAYAASALGRKRVPCALPMLVPLLSDDEKYGSEVTTDPYREVALTVGDAALKALETITMQRARTSDRAQQAKLFRRWWSKNGTRLNCKTWN